MVDAMTYITEYRKSAMPLPGFRQKYQDREKYMTYCRECPNYGTVWSCPPLSFEVEEYLSGFAWVNILCAKIILSDRTIAEADTPEKIKSVGWEMLLAVKLGMEEKLRHLEKALPGSVSLSSGSCNLCSACSRKDGKPCRQPDKMRYSLDAFGFDLSAITKDMFAIDILWCKDRLPDYFTLIHGILTKDEMPADLWDSLGLKFAEVHNEAV
ncbi:DUF2284 domain-containing protein [uncultured Mitsuokella sp.]|uniref:DUF2284 domain-containing protein n=1 Tax=uncultured Mitsuokella sp. TaxID=453120 RepID=UPI0026381BE0|nr:DUF2284 domain-containing protein [uncultured Mitsuokella sp.]